MGAHKHVGMHKASALCFVAATEFDRAEDATHVGHEPREMLRHPGIPLRGIDAPFRRTSTLLAGTRVVMGAVAWRGQRHQVDAFGHIVAPTRHEDASHPLAVHL
ncbi:MAG: hypothetical protein E6G60_03780 [Actinobacteria bacterium]|nr:MAG: hypothetical protein E6G60_03780 [Actinomycetota bacterium]